MVVADPAAELLRLVQAQPDPAPTSAPAATVAQAHLIRRRFGVSLPRPGTVYGYVDCGPAHPDDAGDRSDVGEVWELYVDPVAQGLGGGARLLAAASAWLDEVGLVHQELSVLRTNPAALAFYRRQGWQPTGAVRPVDLGVVAFEELRLRRGAAQVE